MGTVEASDGAGGGAMAPGNIEKARRSAMSKPVVRSAAATKKLATSLRRLGADDRTVAKLTGKLGRV
jgi:hypothetical protein